MTRPLPPDAFSDPVSASTSSQSDRSSIRRYLPHLIARTAPKIRDFGDVPYFQSFWLGTISPLAGDDSDDDDEEDSEGDEVENDAPDIVSSNRHSNNAVVSFATSPTTRPEMPPPSRSAKHLARVRKRCHGSFGPRSSFDQTNQVDFQWLLNKKLACGLLWVGVLCLIIGVISLQIANFFSKRRQDILSAGVGCLSTGFCLLGISVFVFLHAYLVNYHWDAESNRLLHCQSKFVDNPAIVIAPPPPENSIYGYHPV